VKAAGYGLTGLIVDGMDVLTVRKTIDACIAESRLSGKAWLLDIKTYRYRGHSMSDPAKYRSKEELECYKEQDPIVQLKQQMIAAGVLSEAEYEAMDNECKEVCQAAADFAESSPEPDLASIYQDIYAE
jgi:pyruvate dehydrogenase E1 component alpha subunit